MKDYKNISDYQSVMERAAKVKTIREVITASFLAAGFALIGILLMAMF